MNNDLNTNTKSKKAYTRLGYTKEDTEAIVDALNQLLANYSVHYQKLRNFHWNVKGAEFFDIHEKFEVQYDEAKIAVDEIAERIRVYGKTPISTMKGFLKTSKIEESGTDLSAMEMVSEVLNDYEILLEYMFHTIDTALDKGDSGTVDMMNVFVKKIEKNHWMFTAFASK